MTTGFIRKNWVYIILLSFVVLLNVLPRLEKKENLEDKIKVESEAETPAEAPTMFVEFEEAQERSKRLEGVLKKDLPLYLFYVAANLVILFIFLLGLAVDWFFIFSKVKKRDVIKKTSSTGPPPWNMGDVFKIIILALTFGYAFFIMLGFFMGLVEDIWQTKFTIFQSKNFRMIFDTIILDFVMLLVIVGFLSRVYKKKLTSLGFAKKDAGRNIFYGACGYVGVVPIIFAIGALVYIVLNILKIKPPPQPIVGLFLAEKNVTLVFVSSAIAAIFGPVIEEIFFRGVMYNAVKKKVGVFWAILATSVLFSFLHTHAMSYFLVGFAPIMILGMVLAYLYEKTGSLIPSITLHILNNVGSVIMVFLFKHFNGLVT